MNFLEQVFEHARDEPFGHWIVQTAAFHSEGLSTASLPVAEDCTIVAIEDAIDRGDGHLLEDFCLRGLRTEHPVESELMRALHVTHLRCWLTLLHQVKS